MKHFRIPSLSAVCFALGLSAALAADDGDTEIKAGVKDSMGRVGIQIFATATDKSEFSALVDPATWTPLEDTVLDSKGALVSKETVLSLSTTATMPANPYTP